MTRLKKLCGLLLIVAIIESIAVANPQPNATADANTIRNLIENLGSNDRDTRDQAVEQLGRIGVQVVPLLSQAANEKEIGQWMRWGSVRSLAIIKAPESKPLMVQLLTDEDITIRGAASWGLSQLGGQDASDPLLKFLQISWEEKDWGDLVGAAEAQNELPDKRAVPLLIVCLEMRDKGVSHNSVIKKYAAQALGKIGDPTSSEALAKQLDSGVDRISLCLRDVRQAGLAGQLAFERLQRLEAGRR